MRQARPQFSALWMISVATIFAIVAFVVVTWLCKDSTIYAPGYSWSKFSSIRNGMTPDEVTRILGPPLSIEPFAGEIHWNYLGSVNLPEPVASAGGPISSHASLNAHFVADMSAKIIGVHNSTASLKTDKLVGKSLDDVKKRYSSPISAYTIPRQTMYWYSKLRNVKGEYVMLIHFSETGKVYQIDADRIGRYVRTPGEWPRPSSLLEWVEWYVL
jgi:outer membrane protein assembly factor BamE (lipoprotein component of BamABCDE complex)